MVSKQITKILQTSTKTRKWCLVFVDKVRVRWECDEEEELFSSFRTLGGARKFLYLWQLANRRVRKDLLRSSTSASLHPDLWPMLATLVPEHENMAHSSGDVVGDSTCLGFQRFNSHGKTVNVSPMICTDYMLKWYFRVVLNPIAYCSSII